MSPAVLLAAPHDISSPLEEQLVLELEVREARGEASSQVDEVGGSPF
jgi:hypothetical protein